MSPLFSRSSNFVAGFVAPPATKSKYLVKAPPASFLNNNILSHNVVITNHRYPCLHATNPVVAMPPSLVTSSSGLGIEAIVSMSLLALQFGLQPSLTRKFTPKNINKSTVVFTQDFVKLCMAALALLITGGWSEAIVGWNYRTWLTVAGIPALLYCVQNFATLIAYQNLSPLTFNVLNQTKTLSAALCCYLLMGKVQSKMQIISLFILFTSACVIEKIIPIKLSKKSEINSTDESKMGTTSENEKEAAIAESKGNEDNHSKGLIAVLLASFISGLAGAFTQKNLQMGGGRNSYLFTMELCVVSLLFMLTSTLKSADGKSIREKGFFHNWTPQTLIPILTNAAGGIVVGLVTKYAGSVKKGFALIGGLLLSGILQSTQGENVGDKGGGGISIEHVVGGILAGFSLWMHSAYPTAPKI